MRAGAVVEATFERRGEDRMGEGWTRATFFVANAATGAGTTLCAAGAGAAGAADVPPQGRATPAPCDDPAACSI